MTRVIITGVGPWQVRFTDEVTAQAVEHTVAVTRDGNRVYPEIAESCRIAADALTPAQLTATLKALAAGAAQPDAVKALGRYLFAALCAPVWSQLEPWLAAAPASLLELGLDLDGAPALLGLPWEVMARGDVWLALGTCF